MNKEQFDQFSLDICPHLRVYFKNTQGGNEIFQVSVTYGGLIYQLCHVSLIISFLVESELQIHPNFQQNF